MAQTKTKAKTAKKTPAKVTTKSKYPKILTEALVRRIVIMELKEYDKANEIWTNKVIDMERQEVNKAINRAIIALDERLEKSFGQSLIETQNAIMNAVHIYIKEKFLLTHVVILGMQIVIVLLLVLVFIK